MKGLRNKILMPLVFLLAACGPSGDTEELKQTIEQNKFGITSILIKPKHTQTLDPVNSPPATPQYYFDHDDTEALQVFGITNADEEILLTDITWAITDTSDTAGDTTINSNGVLTTEALPDNQTKQITVTAIYATLTASAEIIISSYPLVQNGLLLKIGDTVVNDTSQDLTVCSDLVLTAEGQFEDGSTRDITYKIDWSEAIIDSNVNLTLNDNDELVFSSHTNQDYTITPSYKEQGSTSLILSVSQTGFQELLISPSTILIAPDDTATLSATAEIDTNGSYLRQDVGANAQWTSADESIVSVDDSGLITGHIEGGPVEVSAQCGTALVTSLVSVTVNNTVLYIKILDEDGGSITRKDLTITDNTGEVVNLKLRAYMYDGRELDITQDEDTNWEIRTIPDSGNPITVNNTDDKGRVTAIAAGKAEVVATYKDRTDDLLVIVTAN